MAYDNSARAARARDTRARVVAAAGHSFVGKGYAATTIREVAEAADVSPETIYKSFGSKAGLLKVVYDVTLAGDHEQVPMAERAEFVALRSAADASSAARAYGELAGWLAGRTGPLLGVVMGSRGADPDLEAFVTTIDAERLTGASLTVGAWAARGWLRPDQTVDRARDLVWTLSSPSVSALLVERGWSLADYAGWVTTNLLTTVLTPTSSH